MINVKIIKDSLISGDRYITIETFYPRIIHSEVLRHRNISHSVASSRAIPTKRYIQDYVTFIPTNLRKNEKGMSPSNYFDNNEEKQIIFNDYFNLMRHVSACGNKWAEMSLAKEQVNRILEPFSYVRDLMTFAYHDVEDVFTLRCHQDAQEEIRDLFFLIKKKVDESQPDIRSVHFPYVDDLAFIDNSVENLLKVSVARCARTSYDSNATDRQSTLEEDINLYDRLIGSKHLSPSEHIIFGRKYYENQILNKPNAIQIIPIVEGNFQYVMNVKEMRRYRYPFSGNLGGDIVQYRKILERNLVQ